MNECKIVEDLLPLYAEDLVSEESGEFIREHCAGCAQCRKLLERTTEFAPTQNEETPNYQKALKRDRTQAILTGMAIAIITMALAAAVFLVGYLPQKLETEPIIFESPDGVHHVMMEPYTSLFGTNEGFHVRKRWRSAYSEGNYQGWMEILDAQWSPDGTDLFLAVRMKNGETRMEIWYHNYGENGSQAGYFPYMTKNGWDYDDLSAECTKLLSEQGKLPSGWTSITYEFVAWGEDSESAHLHYTTDNGHEGTTCFGFNFAEHKIWIIE